MSKLRDFQAEDVDKIFSEWEEHRSTLYVAATGLGKTRVIAEVVRRQLPKRTIFLCHRTELIFQARETFIEAGIECAIEKAELIASTNLFTRSPVVLATVQTLLSGEVDKRRMTRFNPNDFGLLVYDESHHAVSPGNKTIVDYFTSRNDQLKVLGVTATPQRADEEAMGQIFESVASVREILFGIDNGWLVNVEPWFHTIAGLDFSHMRTTAGDLNGADLSAVMEAESSIQGVVHPTLEALARLAPHELDTIPVPQWGVYLGNLDRSKWRRSIVFTVSVKQAEVLCGIFNRVIPGIASWVCGKTSDQERQQVLDKFKKGSTSILVNVGITTEGYDNPWVDLIVMARPTKSELLYRQCAGRGTRVLPGLIEDLPNKEERIRVIKESAKPVLTIMDFVGNSGKHKLMSVGNLLGGNVSDAAIELAVRKAKESAVPVNMTDELIKAEEELRKKQEEARLHEEARKSRLVAKVKYTSTYINPFNVLDLVPMRERGWDSGKALSEKQRGVLLKMGVDPDSIPYAQGKQLLVEQFRRWNNNLCSIKQASLLKKYCWVLDPKNNRNTFSVANITRDEASKMIDQIATKQGWQKRQSVATNLTK
jgi:superfamily II DNA or RNA helicase